MEKPSIDDALRWLSAMVESTSDAIIGATLDMQIIIWNPGAERMYGFTADEIVGQHLSLLVPPDRHRELEEIIEIIKRSESVSQYETVRLRKDGRLFHVNLTVSPVRADNDEILGFITVVQDISERKHSESEQERLFDAALTAREEAEDALRVREQFLSIASHELRTPLTSLLGYTSMLQTYVSENTPAFRKMSERIIYQAGRLNELIEQMLDVSRIQRGLFVVDASPIDLVGLVTQSVDNARSTLQPHSKHTIGLHVPAEPVLVKGDVHHLEQVIQNLLSNAIKYSPGGGTVDVSVTRTESETILEVADLGIGIPAIAQARLLEPFYRASNTGNSTGGFGIGLYVVAAVVEHHHGRIEIESVEGIGSTFRVILPAFHEAQHM